MPIVPDTPNPLDYALKYLQIGWWIFPCRGKEPMTRAGYLNASNRDEHVRDWWTRHPDANIGIATGLSGLAVVDIDPRNGGDAWLDENRVRLPKTLECTTGGGGMHLYYTSAETPSRKLAPGVELKGSTGYVIAPPSRHPNGNLYRWSDRRQPVPLPEWLAVARVAPWEPRERQHRLPLVDWERVRQECAFAEYVSSRSEECSEPVWYAALSLVAQCERGDRLAHEVSFRHRDYTYEGTEAKFRQAASRSGPARCQHIEHTLGFTACAVCPHHLAITSPVELGRDLGEGTTLVLDEDDERQFEDF